MTTSTRHANVPASMDASHLPLRIEKAQKAVHKARSLPHVRQDSCNDGVTGAQRDSMFFRVSGDIYHHSRPMHPDGSLTGSKDQEIKVDSPVSNVGNHSTEAFLVEELDLKSPCDVAMTDDPPIEDTIEESKSDALHQLQETGDPVLQALSNNITVISTISSDQNVLQELPFYFILERGDEDTVLDSLSLDLPARQHVQEEGFDCEEKKTYTASWENAIPSIVILDTTGQPVLGPLELVLEGQDSAVNEKGDKLTLFKWPDSQPSPCTTAMEIGKKDVSEPKAVAQPRRWSSPVPEIPTSAFEFQKRPVATNSASSGTLTTDQGSLPRLRPRSSSSNDVSSRHLKDTSGTGPTAIFKEPRKSNDTTVKAHTTKIQSKPSKADVEDLKAILDLLPQKQCLAMGVKGPCKARISRDNVEQALRNLRTIGEGLSDIDQQGLDERLEEVASLLVCKNRHQSQARGIALRWSPMFRNSAQSVTEDLSSSTKTTGHRNENAVSTNYERQAGVLMTPRSRTGPDSNNAFRFIEVLPIIFIRKLEPWSQVQDRSHQIGPLVQKALERPLLKTETRDGFVYIYKVYGSFGHIKIGYTTRNVDQRMREWKNQCGHDPSVEYPQGSDLLVRIPHARRIEALLKIELATYRRRETQCKKCGGVHEEWYETSLEYAIEAARAWSVWMRDLPYEETGTGWTLRSAQKARLDQLVEAVSERARVAEEKRLRKPPSPDRRRPRSTSRRKSEQPAASRQRLSVSPSSRYNLRSRSQPAKLDKGEGGSRDPKRRAPPKVMDSWREDRVVTRSQRILLAQRRSQEKIQVK